jgi:superfamily II DNA or RNA helicase
MSNTKSHADFILNKPKKGIKVLSSIQDELRKCDEFYISVAFITESGITPLLQDLKELENKNIKGKILTTDYLGFSQPKALKRLNKLKNLEVKMFNVNNEDFGFHTKGYIFKNLDEFNILIGSSNLTQKALTVNKEWNLMASSTLEDDLAKDVLDSFNRYWKQATPLEECIKNYEELYKESQKNRVKQIKNQNTAKFQPNLMQQSFIKNLEETINNGEERGILISATGTGKTCASIFGIQKIKPEKILFLVHREQIAKQAMETYKIFFPEKQFGLFSGNQKEYNADYIFSTMQTMSKEEIHKQFKPDEFDFIIIDEVHRAGAPSYQKIMNYFKPKFYLGMTGSPDRSDDFDIYELFNHNIIYEIRLKDALDEDMLCTFHYFGITDLISLENEELYEKEDFNLLTSDQRVKNIINRAEYYGYCGKRVKGLIFCNRNEIAKELSQKFNKKGYRTISLSGQNSIKDREDAIDRLVSDTREDYLDYIFTVDIFNEGVDIPEINQIIMLRPTESSIIFIQQLGRGLRKSKGKEYVVILDFIGNYDNNFLIPVALSGDRTYNKDKLRKYLMEGNRIIPGSSTVSFDEVSKKNIFESINKARLNRIAFLKNKYMNLKFKLGRIPYLYDFLIYDELDPMFIIDYMKKTNSFKRKTYYNFLKKVDSDYLEELDDLKLEYLQFISLKLANGKRPHELIILKELIKNNTVSIEEINTTLLNTYNMTDEVNSIKSAINILNKQFDISKEQEKYSNVNFFDLNNNQLEISPIFKQSLQNKEFRNLLNDLIKLGLKQFETKYQEQTDKVNLKLYEKYSRLDVCRLLNWPHDDSSTLYGYRIKHNTCPIFVTYHKNEDISSSTKYQDEFIDKENFSWMTRSNVHLDSKEPVQINNYQQTGLKLHLFIKKSDDEGSDFYYIGPVTPKESKETEILNDKGKSLPIVNFKLELNYPVREDIYNYFII